MLLCFLSQVHRGALLEAERDVLLRSGLPPSQRHSVVLEWMVARVVSLCTHTHTRISLFVYIYLSIIYIYIYIYIYIEI